MAYDHGRLDTQTFINMRFMLQQQSTFELMEEEDEDQDGGGGMSDFSMSLMHSIQAHVASYQRRQLCLDDSRSGMYEPWSDDDGLSAADFLDYTSIPKHEFLGLSDEFLRLPMELRTSRRFRASRAFCLFLLYFRWRGNMTWKRMEAVLNINMQKLCDLYLETVEQQIIFQL